MIDGYRHDRAKRVKSAYRFDQRCDARALDEICSGQSASHLILIRPVKHIVLYLQQKVRMKFLPMEEESESELFWESTYAIVVALMTHFPDIDPTNTGLYEMAKMIESLPGFSDDPTMATERILMDIQIIWYEEASNL